MNEDTVQRLFGFADAFEHSVTTWITGTVITSLVAALIAVRALRAFGRLEKAPYVELIKRIRSWGVIAPLLIVPILLGGGWVILGVAILSILCYREYARATGLFRHPVMMTTSAQAPIPQVPIPLAPAAPQPPGAVASGSHEEGASPQ